MIEDVFFTARPQGDAGSAATSCCSSTNGAAGCGAGEPYGDSAAADRPADTSEETAVITAAYSVEGMTCGHCVSAMRSELQRLPSVLDVQVALVAGGVSTVTVTSEAALAPQDVRAAVDEAGYRLTDAGRSS